MTRRTEAPATWSALLADAVSRPGVIAKAYFLFHAYSVGNQFLAQWQCHARKLEPGPINTFRGWLELGRHVKKGEKAIVLCQPITVKRKYEPRTIAPVRIGDGAERQLTGPGGVTPDEDGMISVTVFTYKPHWFVLSQTDGDSYQPQELPSWSESRALAELQITRIAFNHTDGNAQGFAQQRSVSVSPLAGSPHKTLFHEMGHVLLGHTAESAMTDGQHTPRDVKEVEAETVALICCESLELPGADHCRGYIQHWLKDRSISDRSAQRIFKAADSILRAGRPAHSLSEPD